MFGECQGKDETPTEWLDHLQKSLQIYSGTDLNSLAGEVLLKTQFVAKSWEDIRKKLEKLARKRFARIVEGSSKGIYEKG